MLNQRYSQSAEIHVDSFCLVIFERWSIYTWFYFSPVIAEKISFWPTLQMNLTSFHFLFLYNMLFFLMFRFTDQTCLWTTVHSKSARRRQTKRCRAVLLPDQLVSFLKELINGIMSAVFDYSTHHYKKSVHGNIIIFFE